MDNFLDKPIQNEDWQLHWLDDQPILFSKTNDNLHLLNSVAGFIWTCCDGKTDVKAIRDALQEVFVDSKEDIANDLPNILESWQKNGLIRLDAIKNYLKTKPNNPSQLDKKVNNYRKI